MPRDVSLSDSKCWNGGQKWVNQRKPHQHSIVEELLPQLCRHVQCAVDGGVGEDGVPGEQAGEHGDGWEQELLH